MAVLQEADHIVWKKSLRLVERVWVPLLVTAGTDEPDFDCRLECAFGMGEHGSNLLHRRVLKVGQRLPLHFVKVIVADGWIGIQLPTPVNIRTWVLVFGENELA